MFIILFFITLLLIVVAPQDRRYAVVPLLPFTVCIFIFIGNVWKRYVSSNKIRCFFLIILCLTISINLGMSVKYRYGFGNFFILLDEAHKFTEENYKDTTFIYTDSIAHFYNFFGLSETNNQYLEYHQRNVSLTDLYFFSIKNPLLTKEKESARLEKTFSKGPQCFMLYKYEEGTKNISIYPTKEETENVFTYTFSEPMTVEYCSVELEVNVYLSKEIVLSIVSDEENATIKISPPLGKMKACEYLCPSINETTKIKEIQIRSDNGLFSKIIDANIHVIEGGNGEMK